MAYSAKFGNGVPVWINAGYRKSDCHGWGVQNLIGSSLTYKLAVNP